MGVAPLTCTTTYVLSMNSCVYAITYTIGQCRVQAHPDNTIAANVAFGILCSPPARQPVSKTDIPAQEQERQRTESSGLAVCGTM